MNRTIVGEVNLISFKHKWIINNFCTNCKKVGEALYSPEFSVLAEGIRYYWQMKLHPKGDKEENKDYLSLFLYNSKNADVTVNFTFSTLDANGIAKNSRSKNDVEIKNNYGHGFTRYLERKQANALLNNDALTVTCDITINYQSKNKKDAVKALEAELESKHFQQLQTLSIEFEQLINQKEFSDISINIGGKTLHAHKSILGKRSCVFAAMFQHNMKEKTQNKLDIVDIRPEVFEEVLRYMYCGKVNNIEVIAVDLLTAADKYSLDGLVKMCEETLANTLSVAGIFESLKLADRFRAKNLRAKAIKFIVLHADEVVNKAEFQQVPNDVMWEVCRTLTKGKK